MKISEPDNENMQYGVYRFSTTFQDEDLKDQKLYVRNVLVHQLDTKKGITRFQLLCEKYEFDDPYCMAFIRKTAYLFDELIVSINLDMRIIDIENARSLQKRWEQLKAEIRQNHAGSEFENYVQSIDSTIYDKEKLISFLESYKMYGLFFKGLWIRNNLHQMPSDMIWRDESIIKVTKGEEDESIYEQYIFQDDLVLECLKKENDLQYEMLCLG